MTSGIQHFSTMGDDNDDCYEDLPPKQIWTTQSSNSSEVSPLPNRESPIKARHVIMGKMANHMLPALCTPDSTQTTTDTTKSDEDVGQLGIAAAPFYGTSRHSNASISSFDEDDEETMDEDNSSIPSFNTQRMILDLQDELARTKAELEHVRSTRDSPHEAVSAKLELDAPSVGDDSIHAVILREDDDDDEATLRGRLAKSEQRVVLLHEKLKESHDIARRLHGTLRGVQKRMRKYALADVESAAEDVIFMKYCGRLLILSLVAAPAILWYDMGLFALLISVTFAAVEIAIRP